MASNRIGHGRTAVVAFMIALLAMGVAQDPSQGPIKFKTDNMVVRNAPSWLFWLEADKWHFKGAGKPIYAHWNDQQLTVLTNHIEGVAVPGKGNYALESATLTDAVKALIERPSASPQVGAVQTVELRSNKADYLAADLKWTLTGAVYVHRTDPAAGEDSTLKGSTGVVTLYPQASAPKKGQSIRTANLADSVLSIKTRRRVEVKGSPGKFEFHPYTFGGTADRLFFDDEAHTITLTGHVKMSGDDPLLQGSVENVDKAVITLDEEGQPKRIEADGDPGVTKLNQKPPPDRAFLSTARVSARTYLPNSSLLRGRREGPIERSALRSRGKGLPDEVGGGA